MSGLWPRLFPREYFSRGVNAVIDPTIIFISSNNRRPKRRVDLRPENKKCPFCPEIDLIRVGLVKNSHYSPDGVDCDLVSESVELLDSGVVGVLVGNEEGGLDGTLVRVDATFEDVLVQVLVVVVYGVVEGDGDYLGNFLRLEPVGHLGYKDKGQRISWRRD